MITTRAMQKAAALGTRFSMLPADSERYPLHRLVEQLDSDRDVAKLLLTIAGETLRWKAGYRPPTMQATFTRACEKLASQTLREAEAIAHLRMMVVDHDWELLLPEWCLYVGLSGQHAPEELVPQLLTYGATVEVTQEFLMMVMGDRAKWMAEALQRKEWKWALYTPVRDAQQLAFQERWKEAIIIDSIYDGNYKIRNHPALTDLATMYYSLWSNKLADAFLYFLRTKIIVHQHLYSLPMMRELLLDALIRFPLNRADELLRIFENWAWHQEHITQLFAFRRNMIEAIYRGKASVGAI